MAITIYETITGGKFRHEFTPGRKPKAWDIKKHVVSLRLYGLVLTRIDATGLSRQRFIEEAVAEKLERIGNTNSG